jgi:hypothetical protein
MDCLTLLIALLVNALILLPALLYLLEGRLFRRQMILGYFTPSIISDYFRQFWAGDPECSQLVDEYERVVNEARKKPVSNDLVEKRDREKRLAEQALVEKIRELYDNRFGKLMYFTPFAALAIVLFLEAKFVAELVSYLMAKNASTLTGEPIAQEIVERSVRLPDRVAVAAIAGAYLAVGLDLFQRVGSLTLLPGDLWSYAIRLAVAPMLGLAVGSFANVETSMLVAFTVAVLPIGDILFWLRSKSAKVIGVEERPDEARDKLIKLPGVDSVVAARLQDQGISTIMQLCEVDPVLLSMRTGLDFTYVIRLVDAGIAWRYFNDKLPLLSVYGWIGANSLPSQASGTNPRASKPIDAVALAFHAAHQAWRDAQKAVADPTHPDHQSTVEAEQLAKAKRETALNELKQAARAQLNHAVIQDVSKLESDGKNRFGFTEAGVDNIIRQIGDDGYARFIGRLLKSSKDKPPPEKPFFSRLLSWFGSR